MLAGAIGFFLGCVTVWFAVVVRGRRRRARRLDLTGWVPPEEQSPCVRRVEKPVWDRLLELRGKAKGLPSTAASHHDIPPNPQPYQERVTWGKLPPEDETRTARPTEDPHHITKFRP